MIKIVSSLGFWRAPLLFVAAFVLFATAANAQTGESPVPLPSPFTPIVDNANVIDSETERKLGAIYQNLKERAQIEFAVVTVDTTDGRDIFEYSLAVYRGWGIGTKTNDGFLLLAAIKDRKYYTQVGYHIEGDLTDGIVGQIQREKLVPAFKQGNYSKGIYDTVEAYVATLAQKRGFTIEGIDQRRAYTESTPEIPVPRSKGGSCNGLICCGVVVLFLFVIAMANRGGRGPGGGRRGGGGGWWTWLLMNAAINAASSSGRSSGWSSGGFGGFSGGGGGGFGGGFGGGSAGGGGAGGSW